MFQVMPSGEIQRIILGGEDAAGTKMKSSNGWPGDGNGTNESGFTGLPAGCRDLNGKFGYIDKIGYWWSSTENDTTLAWYRCIDRSPYYVYRTNYHKQNGLSVRCIKDQSLARPSLAFGVISFASLAFGSHLHRKSFSPFERQWSSGVISLCVI